MSKSLRVISLSWIGLILIGAAKDVIAKGYIVSAGIGYFVVAVALVMLVMAVYALVLAIRGLKRGEQKITNCIAIALSLPTIYYCFVTASFFLFFLGVAG